MGFSSALQGRAAHEALIVRQDAELRLMETMKRAIQMIAKCDKEYAISLAAAAQQGLKIDRADDLQDSLLTKSWRTYMDELDQQSKQFKTNAELLEVVCEKLGHLSQDKRKARKAYQEEHARIAARLNHLTDEVVRKKGEYQKHLEGYKALRTRFEEYYIKAGRGGRKLDDVRDKYQKACRKLHLTHNEYVLSITEAIEVEKDFRTVLLPGLLEHQQSVQESFILLWKNILQEASQHSDLTSDKFNEIQRRIDAAINSINPSEEYREFTEKHKTLPTTPLIFQFDDTLIEDVPGKLQSNTLTVDNLTVDWLRTRLLDLEISVKDCQEKQYKMIDYVNGGSPIANGNLITNGNNTNIHSNNKDMQNRQSKDLNALRCQEKQKQKLVDMIKYALNEIGCEELPSGCDDHLTLDQTFIENGFDPQQQTSQASTTSASVSILNELRRRGGVLTLWTRGRPFKRKSTPQPTTPTAHTRGARFAHKLQSRSQSLGSLSVTTANAKPYAKYESITTNPLRMAASVEANHCYGLHVADADFLEDDTNLQRTVLAFGKSKENIQLPKFRGTQISMLSLDKETTITHASPIQQESTVITTTTTNNNNNNNNNSDTATTTLNTNVSRNNNIYADLDLNCINNNNNNNKNNNNINDDCDSIKSGEVAVQHLTNVEIEINAIDANEVIPSHKENKGAKEDSLNDVYGNPSDTPNKQLSKLEKPLNSIDKYLDKIDVLNRALDDRFKRNLPSIPIATTQISLDAIDSADSTTEVKHRDKPKLENSTRDSSSSKRNSSSSCDSRSKDMSSTQCAANTKQKRSLSFSQKSINAIFSNIREFSRSPLARIHKSHSHPLAEGFIMEEQESSLENSAGKSQATESKFSDTTNESGIATDSEALTNNTNPSSRNDTKREDSKNPSIVSPRLKFKVPKIQKKSKAIRNTFRTKLMNFQMKRGKICRNCTKRRRIQTSKSMFDFSHDLKPSSNVETESHEDFCTCPTELVKPINQQQRRPYAKRNKMMVSIATNTDRSTSSSFDVDDDEFGSDADDGLSFKDHCYCVPSLATSISLSTNRPLYEEEWFHGVLPREEVVRLLNNDGDFLVRETIRNEESQIVLSVCWNGHKHFIVQTTADGHFRFEGPPFPSIQELIMHQYQSELPVTVKSGAILRRPICRERWELSNDDVVLCEKIGRGNFGDVYKAKLKSTKQDVAVKTCRMALPDEQKRKFLQEGRILKQYDHPNIVKLIGICVQKQPIMIVMELVPGGSLLNYLRKNSNTLTTRQQMGMCRDASAGMRYLESKNCIHRDLAARNCLVDFENSVKISDFGMSREEEEYIVSDGMKQIPVKWTAPEALNFGKYTCLCDVWSYGILMWEIFSRGDTPYSGMSNSRARERIDNGYRMPAPENTPPEMYRLMLKCWAAEAESRPHFDEIFNVVDALIIRLDNSH